MSTATPSAPRPGDAAPAADPPDQQGRTDPPDDLVAAQYETFPYPARDPAEEATRLVEGSPSHPVEIDHMLFGGRRDWSRPFRALVAGGGTGDGLVMLAQKLADIGCPAEITYLDLSAAARGVAEARIAARGLAGVRFVTADLAEAPRLARETPAGGQGFDYIDCCGVLHHLPDPDAGFAALAAALAPGGGIGLMVYAPHGRSGVYPLQAAFARLFDGDPPGARPALARPVIEALPPTNLLKRNPLVGDHVTGGDAGLYDLLLHARDRPYTIDALDAALGRAGLAMVSPVEPARYDPVRYLPRPDAGRGALAERLARLAPVERMGLAEALAGNMKTHVVYAAPAGEARRPATAGPAMVPHLSGAGPAALAQAVAREGRVTLRLDGLAFRVGLPRGAAKAIAAIDGRRTLGEIAAVCGRDWLAFAADWAPAARALEGFGLLHYSRGARR
ncbi:MAG: class I SAM-dependent methyltransferase [Pseudomonadota bacterium]